MSAGWGGGASVRFFGSSQVLVRRIGKAFYDEKNLLIRVIIRINICNMNSFLA